MIRAFLLFLFAALAIAPPAFAQSGNTGGIQLHAALGQSAYTHERKALPEGFHDFVQISNYRAGAPLRDVFCKQWEKVLSVHKRVKKWEASGRIKADAYELALQEVVLENGRKPVCWWGTVEDTTEAIATRGYVEKVGTQEVLRPVRIHRLRNGTYAGYHL